MSIENIAKYSGSLFWWLITFELFGVGWLAFLYILYAVIALTDCWLWGYIAKITNTTSSRKWDSGLITKVIWFILLGLALLTGWVLSWAMWSEVFTRMISISLAWFFLFKIGYELISILENLNIISDKNDQKLNDFILKWLNKVIWLAQDKIDQKMERYK